jgi:hypothetical protein
VLEAISTTCSVIGGRVLSQHPAAVQQLVVPLLNRWQAIGFVERDVVPILEALNNMSMGLGPAFEPYAPAVFEKGVMLLQLQQEARAGQVRGCRCFRLEHWLIRRCCCCSNLYLSPAWSRPYSHGQGHKQVGVVNLLVVTL